MHISHKGWNICHPLVNNVANRHTPIKDSVRKICETVQRVQVDYEISTNHQRINSPQRMDRSAFKYLIVLITHHAIKLISRELDAAKLLAEDFNQQVSFGVEGTALIEPTGED